MRHFWYSPKMAALQSYDGDEPNKCKIKLFGIETKLEYTHCHSSYIEAGGSQWGDEVYLGFGEISHIGAKPSMDDWDEPITYKRIDKLFKSIEYAQRIKDDPNV